MPRKWPRIESVIHRLDIRRAQVLVEAIIVEMEVIDGQDLGMQWLFADQSGVFGSNINAADARARNIADAVLPRTIAATTISTSALLPAPSPVRLALSLGWGQVSDSLSMTVILSALKEQTQRQYPVHAQPADPG